MASLRYSYRIYPTPEQRIALAQTFGCVRVVWNDALARSKVDGTQYSGFAETSRLLTMSKKTPDRSWLNDVAAVTLQQSIRNLDGAFQRFFKGLKGKGPRTNYQPGRANTINSPLSLQKVDSNLLTANYTSLRLET